MLDMNLMLMLGGFAMIMGLAGSLLHKIVWDWLKSRGGEKVVEAKPHCGDHPDCVAKMEGTEKCLNHLKRDVTTSAAARAERDDYIKQRLDDGDERMKDMSKSIQSIDKSLTKLVTIVEERTKNNQPLMQGG